MTLARVGPVRMLVRGIDWTPLVWWWPSWPWPNTGQTSRRPPTAKGDLYMPVTPTHAAVVLNGLPDRDDPAAVLVTVRCPHCGDRNVHGLPAPVRVGRDGTFGHRAALCGAAAGYWVVDPNGRVGVILRRHAKHALSSPRRGGRQNRGLLREAGPV